MVQSVPVSPSTVTDTCLHATVPQHIKLPNFLHENVVGGGEASQVLHACFLLPKTLMSLLSLVNSYTISRYCLIHEFIHIYTSQAVMAHPFNPSIW